jgi:hypothetical protein
LRVKALQRIVCCISGLIDREYLPGKGRLQWTKWHFWWRKWQEKRAPLTGPAGDFGLQNTCPAFLKLSVTEIALIGGIDKP